MGKAWSYDHDIQQRSSGDGSGSKYLRRRKSFVALKLYKADSQNREGGKETRDFYLIDEEM